MAYQGFAQEYLGMPAVTRAYTTACVLTTAAVVSGGRGAGARGPRGGGRGWPRAAGDGSCSACLPQQLEFITPFQLYFNPDLIFRKFQVRPRSGCGARRAPCSEGRL